MSENKLLYKKNALRGTGRTFSKKEDYKALEELIKIQSDVFATLSYLLKAVKIYQI